MHNLSNIFYTITYIFMLINLIDLVIILYIIYYKNHPIIEVAANTCYHCITKGVPLVGALHISSNIFIIKPNLISNWYQIIR